MRHMCPCDLTMCLRSRVREFESVELRGVDYAHCSTSHVAALALQALRL